MFSVPYFSCGTFLPNLSMHTIRQSVSSSSSPTTAIRTVTTFPMTEQTRRSRGNQRRQTIDGSTVGNGESSSQEPALCQGRRRDPRAVSTYSMHDGEPAGDGQYRFHGRGSHAQDLAQTRGCRAGTAAAQLRGRSGLRRFRVHMTPSKQQARSGSSHSVDAVSGRRLGILQNLCAPSASHPLVSLHRRRRTRSCSGSQFSDQPSWWRSSPDRRSKRCRCSLFNVGEKSHTNDERGRRRSPCR